MTVSVLAPAFVQRGSEDIEIVSAGGGVPMNVTLPATAPAVAGSTGFVIGAAGAGAGFSPPPQAAAPSAATRAVTTRIRITANYYRRLRAAGSERGAARSRRNSSMRHSVDDVIHAE